MKLVQTMTCYKSGRYPVLAIADDSIQVGDTCRIRVLSGYDTCCTITGIVREDLDYNDNYRAATILTNYRTPLERLKEDFLMPGIKTVQVKHSCSTRLNVVLTDLDVKVGQTVVYESDNGFHVGVVTIVDVNKGYSQYWIVDTVDVDARNARLEKAKRIKKLKAILEVKKQQFQDIELLRLIAAQDPETNALLEEYTQLIGG